MDVELLEIRDFLAAYPPFDALPAEALDRLPSSLSIRYLRRGATFPPPEAGPGQAWLIRQGAVELRAADDALVATLAEGALVGGLEEEDPLTLGLAGRAIEDTLVYQVPRATLASLRASHPEFERHFALTLQARLRRQGRRVGAEADRGLADVDVASLVTRPPCAVPPEATIREAAQAMVRERISSLLVMRGEALLGIVTDRDLRQRCLAAGLAPDRPVSEIMTAGLQVVERGAPAFEALLRMTRHGIHHLPVVDRGAVVGLVTTTDLVRHQGASAAFLVSALRRAASTAELAAISARLPELQIQLVASGVAPRRLGQAVSAAFDALTVRLVELAEAQLGPAPVPFAWLACGSQGRHEQTIHTDQDNALLLDDGFDEARHGAWFEAMARLVVDGLVACGVPRCGGDVMATNPRWRLTCAGWRRAFEGWIARPERKALMHLSLFFDLRAIAGERALLEPIMVEVRRRARGDPLFMGHLAANAVQLRPPLGIFRQLVVVREGERADTLDLKMGGILPVVDLARVAALDAGADAVETTDRLRAAAGTPALSRAGAQDLEAALGFFGAVRAGHQAGQAKRGVAPDNHVPPAALSPLEQAQLRDAFAAVRQQQEALGRHFKVDQFR